jgi:hypothetical protein
MVLWARTLFIAWKELIWCCMSILYLLQWCLTHASLSFSSIIWPHNLFQTLKWSYWLCTWHKTCQTKSNKRNGYINQSSPFYWRFLRPERVWEHDVPLVVWPLGWFICLHRMWVLPFCSLYLPFFGCFGYFVWQSFIISTGALCFRLCKVHIQH